MREAWGCPTLPTEVWWPAIPETCPPGEGMVWLHLRGKCTMPINDDHT